MQEIHLDGRNWHTKDDFYDAFFAAVHAPSWHGRNFNALRDSIGVGQINGIEAPYSIVISGYQDMMPDVKRIVEDFADLVSELSPSTSVEIHLV